MKPIYLLLVDKAWARLYRSVAAGGPLVLAYHQALFGAARADDAAAQNEIARGLCRLLRADRLTGKYDRLVMLASPAMIAALRRQYDGDWNAVDVGSIDELPARYTDEDLAMWLQRRLARTAQPDSDQCTTEQMSALTSAQRDQ
ncbi:MAG: hypothetical protein SV422_09680 [Pseudomonadota bacterium]|nr:hypothetical protein [Pseudomonadota bacterium]